MSNINQSYIKKYFSRIFIEASVFIKLSNQLKNKSSGNILHFYHTIESIEKKTNHETFITFRKK